MGTIERVKITEEATAVVDQLREKNGELMFHQSGGCCDGSSPMCYPKGEFIVGSSDVWLGEVAGCDFYMAKDQFEFWQHTELTIDVVEGRGASFSLSQPFDMNGPQQGWRRRTNPVHTMLDTGTDAAAGTQGFPHGIGGADDVIAMPLQCSTQWDGLGHIFDHGMAWNGRRAGDVVTSDGDLVTGIENTATSFVTRGVLLDVAAHLRPESGELEDGYAITAADLDATIAAQGSSSAVGRGDIVVVRTGRYTRALREGWNGYAGGSAAGSCRARALKSIAVSKE